jgi:hypothetical protein
MLLLRGPLSVSAQSPASETLRVRNLVILSTKKAVIESGLALHCQTRADKPA